MTKIVFICLGNICRSPMAEFIMKDLVEKEALNQQFHIISAGTSGYHDGEDMHQKTRAMLNSKNIKIDHFTSKKLTKDMCKNYDKLIVMDDKNLQYIKKEFKNFKHKINKITDYIPELGYKEIPDPWYSGDFDETYFLLSNACKNLLNSLKNF